MRYHASRILTMTLFLFPFLLLAGCAAQDEAHNLDLTLLAYERTIRWGQLYDSHKFQKDPQPVSQQERERLKQIKITGYDLITREHTPGKYVQVVDIKYYYEDQAVIRTITDTQEWEYVKDKRQWLLLTTLPTFK